MFRRQDRQSRASEVEGDEPVFVPTPDIVKMV